MITVGEIEKKKWWGGLEFGVKELLRESLVLVEKVGGWERRFHDYSFVVFPAAKAYEGFLKGYFLSAGLISQEDYYGKHFRIGKALNPDLDEKYRNRQWVYKALSDYCKGEGLPKKLWETWRRGRNLVFHWFPEEKNSVSFEEACQRVEMIVDAIEEVNRGCGLKEKGKNGGEIEK
jgi:hypothetical protein